MKANHQTQPRTISFLPRKIIIIIYLANERTSTMTVVNKKNNINVDYWIGEESEAGEKKGRLGGGGKGVG